jgi:threonine/homoserine/homoserine lactone efflux protein
MIVIPGPDFAIVVKNGLVGGPRLALPTAIGAACGLVIWGVLAAAGIAAVLASSAVVFAAIKLAGALYLIVVGVLSLRQRHHLRDEVVSHAPSSRWRGFLQGFLCDLVNPKSGILYVALIPQFLPTARLSDILVLAGVNNVLALIWFIVVAFCVGSLRTWLGGRVQRWLERMTGCVLVGLGLRLVVESR